MTTTIYVKNKNIKFQVFNQIITNCIECSFYYNDKNYCMYLKENIIDFDEHKNCPFNKSLTKEDIKSFGFKYLDLDDENRLTFVKNHTYLLLKKNNLQIFKDLHGSFKILLDDMIITSKPHLQFILQSLNII